MLGSPAQKLKSKMVFIPLTPKVFHVAEAAELWLSRRKTRLLERGSLRTYSGYVTHITPLFGTNEIVTADDADG